MYIIHFLKIIYGGRASLVSFSLLLLELKCLFYFKMLLKYIFQMKNDAEQLFIL